MEFGPVETAKAIGCILAHGVKRDNIVMKKGRLLNADDVRVLQDAGISNVIVARLGPDDVPEDEAARLLALSISGQNTAAQQAFTGRANVHASADGLLIIDAERIRAINHLHESLTIATLRLYTAVRQKQMLATVKVIPFAVPRNVLKDAVAIAGDRPLLHLRSFQRRKTGLVITTLPNMKSSLVEKSQRAMAERLQLFGQELEHVRIVPHMQSAVEAALLELVQAGCDSLLLFGASAIVDRADIIPAAVVGAGGTVQHLGMPVDPGNLLMLGALGEVPVLGVPSCARSPKRNGFDWVLERVMAGIAVLPEDIMDMGVGGLLAEIPSRPSPREAAAGSAPKVVAIVLAAGFGSRMGGDKMRAIVDGKPMVAVTVRNTLASAVDDVIVVTGHDNQNVEASLAGLNVRVVHNPHYASGLATSLRAGIEAAGDVDAVVVCLGDMPRVTASVIDKLIAAFNPVEHRSIVVPRCNDTFGNPVLWGAEHFGRLTSLIGDKGARKLLAELATDVTEVEADEGVLVDADTPEALAALRSAASS
jgi:molybdenum cofactor cytidylyltransferase